MNWHALVKSAQRLAVNNSPAIMTAIAVGGTLSTAFLAARAGYKAAEHLERGAVHPQDLTPKEKFEETWKFYIPAVATAALTVSAVICANRISSRRVAAFAAAYSVLERTSDEYRAKVTEKLGERKEQAIHDEIAQERVRRDPVTSREVIITGNGKVLCYDDYTGRYFESDMETLRKAQNDINDQIINDHYASLSDFYDCIGLPQTGVSDAVGWNLDKRLELHFSTTLSDDNRPCIVVTFEVSPAGSMFRCL